MLTCREVAEQADAYLESELGAWAGLRILVHLKLCSACQNFMRQMTQTRVLVENVNFDGELAAPGERTTSLLRELEQRQER